MSSLWLLVREFIWNITSAKMNIAKGVLRAISSHSISQPVNMKRSGKVDSLSDDSLEVSAFRWR